MGAGELSLALSPLLSPLRFACRAGVARLKDLEPLVARVVASARAYAEGSSAQSLERLAAAAEGFDSAGEPQRRKALAAVVRELSALVPVPEEISALTGDPLNGDPEIRGSGDREIRGSGDPEIGRSGDPVRPAARTADPLATPLIDLRGVGPALFEKLEAKGLRTVEDLLLFLPRKFEDRRAPRTVAEAPVGERSVIAGRIGTLRETKARQRRIFELPLSDERGGRLTCVWFNYRPSFLHRAPLLAHVLVSGEVRYRGGGKVIYHPDVELADEPGARVDESFGRVVPIYSEIEGIYPRQFRRIAKRAVDEYVRFVPDDLPQAIRARRKLLPLPEALREAHFPEKFADDMGRGEPRRRLAFDELFMVQLGLALRRRGVKVEPGIAFRATEQSLERIAAELPWPLTRAQKRAIGEIAADMRKPEPMNRLLQGDVGSGKTAVALLAARLAALDGYQAALMAPTEILAEQHAASLQALLSGGDLHVELVTGSLSQRERNHGARLLRSGAAQIVVGTHALAEEATAFHRLGLVVIDEQHRFGVMTRARLMSKGHRPDVLVMTATPIPRTLALTLYGDLDVSVLDELPPGRTPIATRVYRDSSRAKAYDVLRRELAQGRQAFVVLPLVEESEKLAEVKAATAERDRLARDVFSGVPIGLVHGRQSAAERQEAMERFRRGEHRILVSTTVIEVGVDIPNATVMLIEHAERFGLSQLHQLRGRVGRGAAKSYCLLVTGATGAEWGPAARQRLSVMEETNDGFRIAEEDLELRGPGEFLGTKQSGLPDFAVAELARDQVILKEAREEAFALVERDPDLQRPENAALRDQLMNRWRGRLSLARVG